MANNPQPGPSSGSVAFVTSFVKSLLEGKEHADVILESKLLDKSILLDNPKEQLSLEAARKRRLERKKERRKIMGAKERRQKRMFQIPEQCQVYSLYEPLHELWKQYIDDLLEGATHPAVITTKLLKADFHGCHLTVIRSTCPNYINLSGIVVQETTNTFKLITKENKLKTVPKAHTVFQFEVVGRTINLYGDHFAHRASERSAKKWKHKTTIEL